MGSPYSIPRRGLKPLRTPLRYNERHPLYPHIVFGIWLTEGNARPVILPGPRSTMAKAGQFDNADTALRLAGVDGPMLGFRSASNRLYTANRVIFGGSQWTGGITALCRFRPSGTNLSNHNIVRKDGEFTPFAFLSGSGFRSVLWTSAGIQSGTVVGNLNIGQLYDAYCSWDLTTLRTGLFGIAETTKATSGTGIASTSGKPLCIGANESNVETFAGDVHYVLVLAKYFPADQLRQYAANPYAMLADPRDDLRRLFVGAGGATAIALAQAAWGWPAAAAGVNAKAQVTAAPAAWAWSPAEAAVNSKRQLALAAAGWSWSGAAIGIAANQAIALAQAAWSWTALAVSVNAKTVIAMAQATWLWTGNAAVVVIGSSIALAQVSWSWAAAAVGVNQKQMIALGQVVWRWSGQAFSSGLSTVLSLIHRLGGPPGDNHTAGGPI